MRGERREENEENEEMYGAWRMHAEVTDSGSGSGSYIPRGARGLGTLVTHLRTPLGRVGGMSEATRVVR